MNYAVIKASGKQYKVFAGSIIEVDKIEGESGKNIAFEEVLLAADGDKIEVGMPYVKGASVTGKIVEQAKGDKVRVAKFKAKSKYRRVTGFRSQLTKIEILGIKGGKA